MSRKPFRLAAAAVTALSVATLGYGGSVAMAEEGGDESATQSNKALIDATATVNLKINKFLGSATGQPNNGMEQNVEDRAALKGVNFDVYKVGNVDLTTNDGWTAAAALSGYTITAADIERGYLQVGDTQYQLALQETVTTGANGQATFRKENGVGLYLVAENLATSGTITNETTGAEVAKASITPSSPFLVTLPMTNPETLDSWMYTVNVYPKNQTDTANKEVDDKGTVTTDGENVGDHRIDYTITTSITDSDDDLGMYVINDNLHESLTFTGATVSLSDGTALVRGTDYNIYTYADAAAGFGPGVEWIGDAVADGPLVSVQFTEAGLEKLQAYRSLSVVTVLNTTIGGMDDDGVVENQAFFIPNDSWWNQNGKPGPDPEDPETPPTDPEKPGIPTPEVESKYGKLIIDKQDPVDGKLDGAVFAVYVDDPDTDEVCAPADVSGDPISTGTTADGGKLTFTGLQASNWYDGEAISDDDKDEWITYCLVETKAPSGYNLDATPHSFVIDYRIAEGETFAYTTAVVNNEKTNLENELPLTGGQGIAALSLIGLALIGGGGAYYAASNRKRTNS